MTDARNTSQEQHLVWEIYVNESKKDNKSIP